MTEHSTHPDTIKSHHVRKTLRIVGISFAALISVILIAIGGLILYFTSPRITSLVNREASKYLNAKVEFENMDYTLFSTFPMLKVTADSLTVVSRSLDTLSPEQRHSLPKDADRLLSTGNMLVELNIMKALKGDVAIRVAEVGNPSLNMVAYDNVVNNYNILPHSLKIKEIPNLEIDSIRITEPLYISYTNIAEKTNARVAINGMQISRKLNPGFYEVMLNSVADASVGDKNIISSLPININGGVVMKSNPARLQLSNMNIYSDGIRTVTNMEMKESEISSFTMNIISSNMIEAAKNFATMLPLQLSKISGKLPVNLEINLTEPYSLANLDKMQNLDRSGTLGEWTMVNLMPAFTILAEVKDADLSLSAIEKGVPDLSDFNLNAFADIDPHNRYANSLEIRECSLKAGKSDLAISGEASEILSGSPLINANIKGDADLGHIIRRFIPSSPLTIAGVLSGNTDVSCRVTDIATGKVENLDVNARLTSPALNIADNAGKIAGNLSGTSLQIDAHLPSLSKDSLSNGRINLYAKSRNTAIKDLNDSSSLLLSAASIKASYSARILNGTPSSATKVAIKAGSVKSSTPTVSISADDITMNISGILRHSPWSPASYLNTAPSSANDSLIAEKVHHTPLYLVASLPSTVQSLLTMLDMTTDVKISSGTLLSKGYPAENRFSGLSLCSNLDTLDIRSLHVESRSTSADLAARISNLRGFLTSSIPAPLYVDLDADFSNIDINQLSGTYYAGVSAMTGRQADYSVPAPGPYTATDSLCVVIPRNIIAKANLKSDKAEYKEWTFSPLSTEITTHNGIARIGKLRIGSDFCNADIDWTYSTEDLGNIFMHLMADVDNFDLDRFFTTFPTLPESSPALANLSGIISVNVEGDFKMFPSMFLNTPSLSGDASLTCDSLEYTTDNKIIRLFMRNGKGPVKVDDFTAHASFHDNLLQVDPFSIHCGPYEVMAGGVNNLQGEIYYHVGMMHLPFMFPFGVNLVGNFHHPEIRFGGKGIKDGREREIASHIEDSADVNIMRQLRQGWLLFIENAAKYDAKNNHDYVFNVK